MEWLQRDFITVLTEKEVNIVTDETLREMKKHGTERFPFHLYASLSLEEAKKTSIKDKQSQIIHSSEHILELLNNKKV